MLRETYARYRFSVVIFLLTLGFFFLSGHGSIYAGQDWRARWDGLVAKAKSEGTVVVFGPPGDEVGQALTRGFERAFPGVRLEYFGASGGEVGAKIRAEREGNVYSVDAVLSGSTTSNVLLKPIGALDPVKPVLLLPEVIDVKNWSDRRLEFADNEGMYDFVFVSNVQTPIAYNLEQARPEEIDELHELLDSKWKGKIVINDPLPPGPGNSVFRLIWNELGREKATDFYRRIRAHAAIVDRDARRQLEWVAQGKYPIQLGANSSIAQVLLKRGLKFGVLSEFADIGGQVTSSFGTAMLINKAPHPNAAVVFINWVLSREGQTAWSTSMVDASRRLDVSTNHLPSFRVPKPGTKYWVSYTEKETIRSAEEEKILKELFGR